MQKIKNIAIIGGGNGGQAFAGYLSMSGYNVRLFDVVQATVDKINAKGGVELTGNPEVIPAKCLGFGKIDFASTDMAKVVEGADFIMVILPSIYHESIAKQLAPLLKDGMTVLLNPNASLGAVHFRKILNDCGCKADILLGACSTLLFACRAVEPGHVALSGYKATLTATALPSSRNAEMEEKIGYIFPEYKFQGHDIIEVSLDNINAFVHPGPTLLNLGSIERGETFRYYLDFTPGQGAFCDAIDKERVAIAKAYGIDLPTIVEEYHEQYNSKGDNVYEVMTTCPGYEGIMGPKSIHGLRYLEEDIPFSLEAICAMADIAGVPTPICHAVIAIGRGIRPDLAEGRTAKNLGIEGMTKEEFEKLCRG